MDNGAETMGWSCDAVPACVASVPVVTRAVAASSMRCPAWSLSKVPPTATWRHCSTLLLSGAWDLPVVSAWVFTNQHSAWLI